MNQRFNKYCPYRWWVTWPSICYVIFVTVFEIVGYGDYHINWNFLYFLDRELLKESPIETIFYMHSQPPLFNCIAAIILKVSSLLGVRDVYLFVVYHFAVGMLAIVLLYRVVFLVTDSLCVSRISIGVVLLDPAFHIFQRELYYPLTLFSLIVLMLFLYIKFLKVQKVGYLISAFFVIVTLVNMRSLYHPVWAIANIGVMLFLFQISNKDKHSLKLKAVYISMPILFALLIIWPIKNKLLFDKFTFSTWTGFNLSRIPMGPKSWENTELFDFFKDGTVPARTQLHIHQLKNRLNVSSIKILEGEYINEGTRWKRKNWNHYVFIDTQKPLVRETIQWRLKNPVLYLKSTVKHYFHWVRPTYSFTNPGPIRNAFNLSDLGLKYAETHQGILFFDFNEWIHVSNIYPFTIYGLILLPLLFFMSIYLIYYKWITRSEGDGVGFSILTISTLNFFWVFIIPCLTDGYEGNRMRFAVTPCQLVMIIIVVQHYINVIDANFSTKFSFCERGKCGDII